MSISPDLELNLIEAVTSGDAPRTAQLLESGANVNAAFDGASSSALGRAVVQANTDRVRLLLEWGADPRKPDRQGDAPLHQAASNGNLEISRLLLDFGADANAADQSGNTPLFLCVEQEGGTRVLELLLKFGADPKLKPCHGETLLEAAASEPEYVRLLLDAGADPQEKTSRGFSLIELCKRECHHETFALLKARGLTFKHT